MTIFQKLTQSCISKIMCIFPDFLFIVKLFIILFSHNWCFDMRVSICGLHRSHKIAGETLLLFEVFYVIWVLNFFLNAWMSSLMKPFGLGVSFMGKYSLKCISEIIVSSIYINFNPSLILITCVIYKATSSIIFSVFYSVQWKINFFFTSDVLLE